MLLHVAVLVFAAAAPALAASSASPGTTAPAPAASASASASASSAPSSSAVAAPPSTANGTATAVVSPPPTFPVTLLSTNPTAIPLASIVSNASAQATVPLDTTYVAGATPTGIPGAPPLPDISTLNPANYPPLDRAPPTDSALVQQWVAEVNASGFRIPNIPVNQVGGCAANPAAVADPNRCWWTCSQCTRDTDIITCPDKMTWGLSFDDGPSPYTPSLVEYLDQQSLKTTFFVVGSRAISRPDFLRSQYMGNHQVAVHTWSHSLLTTQTNDQVVAELAWSKKVIKDILGVTPLYFRPPYGDTDDRIRAIAAAMGLTQIIWTSGSASNHISYDTSDFTVEAGLVSSSGVIRNFTNILGNASQLSTGFIVLEHDLFQQSVDLAVGYTIPQAISMNFTLKPVVSCINKPLSDAYLETNDNTTNPLPSAVGTSIVAGGASTLSPGAPGSTGTTASSGNGAAGVRAGALFAAAQVLALGVLGAVAAL